MKLWDSPRKARQEGLILCTTPRALEHLAGLPEQQRWKPRSIYLTADHKFSDSVERYLGSCRVEVDRSLLNLEGLPDRQPFICVLERPEDASEELPEQARRILVLDHLQDPGNTGTLIRTAVACHFDAVLLWGGVDLSNRKTVNATAGTFPAIHIQQSSGEYLKQLQDKGWAMLAAGLDGQVLTSSWSWPERSALLIGTEGRGLSGEALALNPVRLTLPMNPACESLNAAVAGSLLMYQAALWP
jgi:TrmH family RNA methyltransferase